MSPVNQAQDTQAKSLDRTVQPRGLTLPFPLRYRNWFVFLTTIVTVRPVRLVA